MATDPAKPKAPSPGPDAGHIPISEEMDSAKWTLPPLAPLLVAGVIVALALGAYLWTAKPKADAAGKITEITSVEQTDGGSVLVLLRLDLKNLAEKPMVIHNLKAQLKTDQGEWSDEAAAAVDHQRYFRAYPELAGHAGEPVKSDDKIAPGGQRQGIIIVSFPVSKAAFDARKSLSVTVNLYDRRPLVVSAQP